MKGSDKTDGSKPTYGVDATMRSFSHTRLQKVTEDNELKPLKDWKAELAADFWLGHVRGDAAGENLGFLTRLLVQVNLPHDEPDKALPAWERVNGDTFLYIVPGRKVDTTTGKSDSLGYPFGVIPRLLLIYLCSEAVRTKKPVINLGRSLSEFVDKIGLRRQGGKRGDITRLKEQLRRLLGATIRYGVQPVRGKQTMVMEADAKIASKWMLLWDWDEKLEGEQNLFESQVELDAAFFNEIIKRPVPLDIRVVSVLRQSPLALDLYTWLTYRVNSLEKPLKLSWGILAEQIGSNYGRLTDFQRKASKAIKEIQRVWPVEIDVVHGGILLKPSKPSVPQIPKK